MPSVYQFLCHDLRHDGPVRAHVPIHDLGPDRGAALGDRPGCC